MNRVAMPSKINAKSLLAAAALLAIAACSPQEPAVSPEEPPLAGAALGGPFTLTGEDGNPVSWNDFDGKYRTIYFGYAYCPDICPTDVQRAMAGLKQFEAEHPDLGAKVQPLFVSVDPNRDTPEVLTEFTANFHPRLIGMTGDTSTVASVAKTFGMTFSKGETQPGGGYLMEHLGYTLLFGPDGKPLAPLPTDLGPDAVAAELEKWVR
jgi:protein SCO1